MTRSESSLSGGSIAMIWGIIAAIVAVVFILLNWLTGWRLGNGLLVMFISNWPWLLLLIVVALLTVVLLAMCLSVAAGTVGLLGALALFVFVPWYASYATEQAQYASVVTTQDPIPTYQERAAFPVVKAQIKSGVTITGTIEPSSYVGGKEFTTLVKRVGWAVGYGQVVVQTVDVTGQSSARQCAFSNNAQFAFDNLMFNDLGMEIISRRTGVIFDEEDAYAYCDGDKPVMVIPLKFLSGGWPAVIEVSGGVAIYNGVTGELSFRDSVKNGEIPGPVYPASLSAPAYKSTAVSQGFWPWVQNQAGLSDTSNDPGDPNAGNVGDFHLIRADRSGSDYVTPLTRVGVSTAIAGVGTVAGSESTLGKLNPYTVHLYPDGKSRRANSALADFIKGSFGTEVPWQNGSMIFEISPVSQSVWVASIGLNQSVQFRVRSSLDGSVCLERANGAKVKCILPDGSVEGAQAPPAETPTTETPTKPAQTTGLDKMTDKELLDLWDRLKAEVEKRMG